MANRYDNIGIMTGFRESDRLQFNYVINYITDYRHNPLIKVEYYCEVQNGSFFLEDSSFLLMDLHELSDCVVDKINKLISDEKPV